MSDQLSFLPEIDRKATQKKVEEALETVRIYKQIGFVRKEMRNTPTYEARYHGPTNATGTPAEECAVWNVEQEERIGQLVERVEKAVVRLPKKEREVIVKRYLEDDYAFDYQVFGDLHISKRTYERIKARAVYKLAFALRMEVFIYSQGKK